MFAKKKAAQEAERLKTREAARKWKLAQLQGLAGVAQGAPVSVPVPLKADERGVMSFKNFSLVESRRESGHREGRSSGISVPSGGRTRVRVGQSRGRYVSGEMSPALVDSGIFSITTNRAVFQGAQQTREWQWAKLLGFGAQGGWIAIHVSNRQKVSGVQCPYAPVGDVQAWLDLAVAIHGGHQQQALLAATKQLEDFERMIPG